MAAFTSVPRQDLARHLAGFGLGEYLAHEPIADGIENSNYLVTLQGAERQEECILTLLETMPAGELDFFNRLVAHLARAGLPVAAPRASRDGQVVGRLCGKPTLVFPRLPGTHLQAPERKDCAAIGRFLGDLHLCLQPLPLTRANPYHLDWLTASVKQAPLPRRYRELAQATVALYGQLLAAGLPSGLIHGDLFLDNALFAGGRLTGVIDFYHACHDLLIQDLAIAINDWCRQGAGLDAGRRHALVQAYSARRPLTDAETRLLLPMQQVSALKFALTRYESGNPPLKDPMEMLELMETLARA